MSVREAAANVQAELDENAKQEERERLEGEAAPLLHEALRAVDIEVLDDPGFWRYLSLDLFWDFIRWREEPAFAKGLNYYLKYVDGERSTECVLTRMYLRAGAVGGIEFGHYTSAVPKATDFWRSHIVRVKTGTAPPVVRAFVDMQQRHRLSTGPLRGFAKVLNRTWSNVALTVYDDAAATDLIGELRRDVLPAEGESE